MKRTVLLAASALGITTVAAVAAQPLALNDTPEAPPPVDLDDAVAAAPLVAEPSEELTPTYNPTRSFAPLVEEIGQAVVSIEVKSKADPRAMSMFRQFGIDPRRFGMDPDQMPDRTGEGSGFVISEDGLMLTNHHVVAGADEVTVRFADGTESAVEILGSDQSMDIALLQLPRDRDWPHLELADSDEVAVGDWVLAMGNPLGLGMTVTAGIISGKGRVLGHDIFGNEDFLQTDAAINPGNSGGPLVDLSGRVVGMNTAIIAGANTVGFSIPTNLIGSILDDLQTEGHVARGFLGVNSQPLTPELAKALGVDADKGAVVAGVFPGTPADSAGLEQGDVVIEVDGEAIDDQVGLVAAIGNRRPGDQVKVTVVRGDDRKKLRVTLAERPGEDDAPNTRSDAETLDDLGLTLAPLSAPLAADKGVGSGVLVERVDRDGPAAGRLRPGDIIRSVNRKEVTDPADVARILGRSTGTAFMVVVRDDAELFVTLPLP